MTEVSPTTVTDEPTSPAVDCTSKNSGVRIPHRETYQTVREVS